MDNDAFSDLIFFYSDLVGEQNGLASNEVEKEIHGATLDVSGGLMMSDLSQKTFIISGASKEEQAQNHAESYASFKEKVLALGEYLS